MDTTLGKGTFLIANPYLTDPHFMKTVVLVCEYNERGAFGLILNRASNINISQIFPNDHRTKDKNNKMFYGGPVDTSKLFCLHTMHESKVHDCENICSGVYLGSSKDCLNDLLANNNDSNSFRLYLGCACWAEGQLDDELKMNTWIIGPANDNLVFYPNPNNIWWYVSQFIDGIDPESAIDSSEPILN